jgi:hypothetical protein
VIVATDPVQQIAAARAAMKMRGYEPLRVDIGRNFWMNLRRDFPEIIAGEVTISGTLLGMNFSIRDDLEGFCVRPG